MSIKQAIEALPPLPEPTMEDVPGELWGQNITHTALFSINQMHEYARAALAALRSMPQGEPVATIRYERGTPGKENDMPKVVSCNWLPDGVYSVYATQHTEAVRMSEAEIGNAIASHIIGESATYNQLQKFARAVEQATAARLGVKMGDV